MADHKEQLLSMLQDMIKGDTEKASVTMHDYFVSKTRDVAGLATAEAVVEPSSELDATATVDEPVPADAE